ncbi:hypothetical protein ANN_14750 [Periplaneta americana]|uniref:Uncharacterized protein n=1 Tax=Periplaneta americana TaxID=6978 RepID=A0ABQ8SYF5_PERAM|nr:hypothetical protein ANN_14750 [Periplaneta americana]
MAGLCEGGNEPPGSLLVKARKSEKTQKGFTVFIISGQSEGKAIDLLDRAFALLAPHMKIGSVLLWRPTSTNDRWQCSNNVLEISKLKCHIVTDETALHQYITEDQAPVSCGGRSNHDQLEWVEFYKRWIGRRGSAAEFPPRSSTLLASHHNRNTRSQHNLLLSIPRHQTSLYSSSFSIATARSWNSLPLEIRGSLRSGAIPRAVPLLRTTSGEHHVRAEDDGRTDSDHAAPTAPPAPGAHRALIDTDLQRLRREGNDTLVRLEERAQWLPASEDVSLPQYGRVDSLHLAPGFHKQDLSNAPISKSPESVEAKELVTSPYHGTFHLATDVVRH